MQLTTTLTGMLLMGTAVAVGQEPGERPQEDKTDRAMGGRATEAPAMLPIALERCTELLGATVRSPSQKELGELDDVLVDSRSGVARYAVLSTGGTLGIGEKLVAIPFRSLNHGVDEDGATVLSVDFEEQHLEDLPEYDGDPASRLDEAWEEDLAARAGEELPTDRGELARLSTVDGAEVVTGEKTLGSVGEIALDLNNDRVAYVVVGTGGVLGIGETDIPFPWKALATTPRAEGDVTIRFAGQTKRLAEAPQYEEDEWERMSSPDWLRKVYEFHAVEPYWTQPIEAGAPRGVESPKKPMQKHH